AWADRLGVVRITNVVVEPDLTKPVLEQPSIVSKGTMFFQRDGLPTSTCYRTGDYKTIAGFEPVEKIFDQHWFAEEPFCALVLCPTEHGQLHENLQESAAKMPTSRISL